MTLLSIYIFSIDEAGHRPEQTFGNKGKSKRRKREIEFTDNSDSDFV